MDITNSKKAKKALRTRMRMLRDALEFSSYRKWCTAIMEQCVMLKEWQSAHTVHIYVSAVNNEVDTLGLIFSLFDAGKAVVVPKCEHILHRLQNIRIKSLDELLPSKYGLMEPEYDPPKEIMTSTIDLIVSPLLAFDRTGKRLGMGGGYYDSLLNECSCPRVGLGYSFQEVDSVPVEPHDQTLDIIITEKEIIRINHE